MSIDHRLKSDVATSTGCAFVTSLMFAALSPATEASTQATNSIRPLSSPFSYNVATTRSKKDDEVSDEISSTNPVVPESPLQKVEAILNFHSFDVDRKSLTDDGSLLFEFLRADLSACVEVFPSGNLVIIVQKDGPADLYEFSVDDAGSIPSILKDAGLPRRKM